MFGEKTVERPLGPASVDEVGYYWLGAGVVAAALVGLLLWNRIGLTVGTLVTSASVLFEFAVFGGAILAKKRED